MPSACEPHRAFITEQLRLRRNYTAIYQDLVDRFGFTASYNSVKRFAGTVVRQVEAMFQEERVHLKPLPLQGFRYFTECERTVADDTCIRIDHSSYAARPALIASRVLVRLYEHQVEIRDRQTHALLRAHPRAQRPGSVLLPDDERPFNPSRETPCVRCACPASAPRWRRACCRRRPTRNPSSTPSR